MDTALVSTLACPFSVTEYVDVGWLYLVTSCVSENNPAHGPFHRKKVMGVLSNYFLGDVNTGSIASMLTTFPSITSLSSILGMAGIYRYLLLVHDVHDSFAMPDYALPDIIRTECRKQPLECVSRRIPVCIRQ